MSEGALDVTVVYPLKFRMQRLNVAEVQAALADLLGYGS